MSKSHANVVSFDENVSYYVFVDLNELMIERNKVLLNETAIKLTAQTLAPLLRAPFVARNPNLNVAFTNACAAVV